MPGLVVVERDRHGEDRVPVLDRDDAPGGEALAVADAVDLVDDRYLGVAGQQEIRVQRVRRAAADVRHRPAGGDQRLADHLTAEHALPADLRRAATEQVHLERLEVEKGEELFDGRGHRGAFAAGGRIIVRECRP
jgi:hypothetical protein